MLDVKFSISLKCWDLVWKESKRDPELTMQSLICTKSGPKDNEGAAVYAFLRGI